MAGYYARLHQKAWEQTRKFWTLVRYWTVFVTVVLAPVVIQILRHGWNSVTNLIELLENGAIGLVVSLAGTYLISLSQAAKILDDERGLKVTDLTTQLSELKLSALISPIETERRSHVRSVIGGFTAGEKASFQHLAMIGKMRLREFSGTGLSEVNTMRNKAREGKLLDEERDTHGEYVYSVRLDLRDAVAFVLRE